MFCFKSRPIAELVAKPQSKFDRFHDIEGTVDYAIPQGWLNEFTDWCKANRPKVTYDMIRSTTCWWYVGHYQGPVTCCDEVNEAYGRMTHKIA